jgi:RsiW-degrading membrane proteinase PrsW (M82 family)
MAVDVTSVLLYSAILAYVPPLLYAVVVRYAEKYKREPWGAVFSAFLWGATIAFLLLTLIRGYISMYLDAYHPELINDPHKARLIQDMILIPLMMIILPLGLITVRHEMEEAEDGLIYGAIVGLGFAATENFLFGFFSIATFGMDYFINLVIVRDLSVMLLYAAAASFVGYGVTRATASVHRKGSLLAMPLFYFAGVGLLWGFVFILDGGPRIYFDIEGMDLTQSYRMAALISCVVGMFSAVIMYFTIYRVDRIDELWDEEDEAEETAPAPPPRRHHPPAVAAHHRQHPPVAAAPQHHQRAAAHHPPAHAQPAARHHHQQAAPAYHQGAPAHGAAAAPHHAGRRPPAPAGGGGRRAISRAPPTGAPSHAAHERHAAPAGRSKPSAGAGRKKTVPPPADDGDEDDDWLDPDYGEEEARGHERKKAKPRSSADDDDDDDVFDFDMDELDDDDVDGGD